MCALPRLFPGRPPEAGGGKLCAQPQQKKCGKNVVLCGVEPRTTARSQCSVKHPGHRAGAHATRVNREAHATRNRQGTRPAHTRPTEPGSVRGGQPGQRAEEASRTRNRGEACCGRPEDGGVWAAKTVKRPRQQPAQPPIRQLLGAADAQTAHPATSSTAPAHQRLGSANAETTPAGALAAAADRTQRPDATCEGENG